jgi:hypothetical protein
MGNGLGAEEPTFPPATTFPALSSAIELIAMLPYAGDGAVIGM